MASEDPPLPSSSTSYDAYQLRLQKSALLATKQAFQLPLNPDLSFHRTLNKSFASELDSVSSRVFSLAEKVLKFSTGKSIKGKGKAVLKSEDDLLEGYHLSVVDVVDQLFENAVRWFSALEDISASQVLSRTNILMNLLDEPRSSNHPKRPPTL